MRRFLTLFLGAGFLLGWQAWSVLPTSTSLAEGVGEAFDCDYAGTWVQSNVFGQEFVWTVTPLDPTGRRFALVGDLASGGLPGSGLFPDVVSTTSTRGTAVRRSANSFEFTLYVTAKDANHQRIYDVVTSGVTVLTGCDTSVETWTFEFFTPEGASVFCGQATSSSKRLGLVPPCGDLPSPSE